jgi:hypothetical protein
VLGGAVQEVGVHRQDDQDRVVVRGGQERLDEGALLLVVMGGARKRLGRRLRPRSSNWSTTRTRREPSSFGKLKSCSCAVLGRRPP